MTATVKPQAVKELKARPLAEFVPALLAEMQTPVEVSREFEYRADGTLVSRQTMVHETQEAVEKLVIETRSWSLPTQIHSHVESVPDDLTHRGAGRGTLSCCLQAKFGASRRSSTRLRISIFPMTPRHGGPGGMTTTSCARIRNPWSRRVAAQVNATTSPRAMLIRREEPYLPTSCTLRVSRPERRFGPSTANGPSSVSPSAIWS